MHVNLSSVVELCYLGKNRTDGLGRRLNYASIEKAEREEGTPKTKVQNVQDGTEIFYAANERIRCKTARRGPVWRCRPIIGRMIECQLSKFARDCSVGSGSPRGDGEDGFGEEWG